MASPARPPSASQFDVVRLLDTATVSVRDVCCRGECRHRSDEECTHLTHLVFPYRGLFVRHVGREDVVAESNQLLCFNPYEGYQVSHPVAGGDAFAEAASEAGYAIERTTIEGHGRCPACRVAA